MARKRQETARTGRTVLLIDDSPDYLTAACRIIERDGHDVLTAENATDALALLRERDVDLVLVDYLMPGLTGEDFVRELRTFRPNTQVVLQTGYASEHPPRELLRRLDIQGFHDKSDGPEKLAFWVDVGLKAAFTVQLLLKSRQGLRYVLEATPSLHRLQPLEDLLQGILLQTAGLLGATNSFLAVGHAPPDDETDGFVLLSQDGHELRLCAATGRFRGPSRLDDVLEPERLQLVRAAAERGGVAQIASGTVAPLRVGTRTLGLVYLDRTIGDGWETELVEVFANQAAVAIQNVSLYEMAALDSLTGTSTRRFFEQATARELRLASRSGAATGMLLIDVDRMKRINDGHGHAAGDRALAALGAALRHAVRTTDFVGRIGGDEFAVLLPGTDAAGVAVVAARVRVALEGLTIPTDGGLLAVGASVGAAVLEAGEPCPPGHRDVEAIAAHLKHAADEQMYDQKRGAAALEAKRVLWSDLSGRDSDAGPASADHTAQAGSSAA